MSKAGRAIVGVLINGAMVAFAVYGLVYGATWALNVVLFATWAMTVLDTIVAFNEEVAAEVRAKGRGIPQWLSVTSDLSILVMFASVGRFFSAAAVLWQICCEASIYKKGI